MSNLEAAIKVIANNSSEVAELVQRFGGIANLLQALPAIYKIAGTIQKANADDPEKAVPLQYGLQTFADVKVAQREFGFTGADVDGIVGDATWREIRKRLNMVKHK